MCPKREQTTQLCLHRKTNHGNYSGGLHTLSSDERKMGEMGDKSVADGTYSRLGLVQPALAKMLLYYISYLRADSQH